MKSLNDWLLSEGGDPLTGIVAFVQRYGMLCLGIPALLVWFFVPAWRENQVLAQAGCMIASLFVGRKCIKQEDIKGWIVQNIAFFVHTALLILCSLTA